MKGKRLILILVIIILATSFYGCKKENIKEPVLVEKNDDDYVKPNLKVMTTLFPQFYFTKALGGDHVEVELLLPPGTEAHSFEPTPKDMVKLLSADLFLFTGKDMEPWAENIVYNLKEEGVYVVDLSENIELLSSDHHDHDDEDHDEDHDEENLDPHYWTDPNMVIIMVDSIKAALSDIDPENALYYEENASVLKEKLEKLDSDIRESLAKTESKTILSGGHFAFGYFAKEYGLDHLSPYAGFSANAEPTPQRITELIRTINETNAKAIFYEELVDPKVTKVIVEETGVEMLLLHGIHNVSKEDLEKGKTYFDFMYENLENLKVGLGYNE